jgi:hypothetical protein
MPGKRRMLESVVGQGVRMTRILCVKLDCLNSKLNVVFGPTHRKNACNRCHTLLGHELWARAIPECERGSTRSIKR